MFYINCGTFELSEKNYNTTVTMWFKLVPKHKVVSTSRT